MCVAVHKRCECGAVIVQFHLRDNVLPQEVVSRLFCPACPGDAPFDRATMVNDNGWIIEFDMQLARNIMVARNLLDPDSATPEYIFDQGYACWLETYPGEKDEIKEEKAEIIKLLKIDQRAYLEKIQSWNINRLNKLKSEGWRKARIA
ncbi:MAG: hypothetical protein KKB30_14645 [Proteobacteria bacterium]|nr:hypothetical protein [Pseudomonadota bacterium]MBU1717141.1 hypothetical protein [Pseudomonadota bacterium]